jgi:hypothetical protein
MASGIRVWWAPSIDATPTLVIDRALDNTRTEQ